MISSIKVGMKVRYRQNFGSGLPTTATIETIEICEPGENEGGESVQEASGCALDNCVVDLDDGSWAYAHQIIGEA